MKKIYIDTNFLMAPAQFGVDIYSEIQRICDFPYSLYVLEESMEELKGIVKKQRGKNSESAKLGIKIAEQKIKQKSLNITAFSKEMTVDDILVEIADSDTIIATQDRELKRRVKQKGAGVIVLKNKNYLEIA